METIWATQKKHPFLVKTAVANFCQLLENLGYLLFQYPVTLLSANLLLTASR